MTTNLVYLDDTFLLECSATVREIGRYEKGAFVILDRTVAYPQGGGQPADAGFLIGDGDKIPLLFVGFKDGEVIHHVPDAALDAIAIGQPMEVKIDQTLRINNARLHTAGHLVSHVIETMEPRLRPSKGYHFPAGSYVEFSNDAGIETGLLLEQASRAIHDAIEARTQVDASYSDFGYVVKVRPHLAPYIPRDKPTRIVTIGAYTPLPCGGTHLADLGQIGTIRITKVKRAKDNLRVSYGVMPAA